MSRCYRWRREIARHREMPRTLRWWHRDLCAKFVRELERERCALGVAAYRRAMRGGAA